MKIYNYKKLESSLNNKNQCLQKDVNQLMDQRKKKKKSKNKKYKSNKKFHIKKQVRRQKEEEKKEELDQHQKYEFENLQHIEIYDNDSNSSSGDEIHDILKNEEENQPDIQQEENLIKDDVNDDDLSVPCEDDRANQAPSFFLEDEFDLRMYKREETDLQPFIPSVNAINIFKMIDQKQYSC